MKSTLADYAFAAVLGLAIAGFLLHFVFDALFI